MSLEFFRNSILCDEVCQQCAANICFAGKIGPYFGANKKGRSAQQVRDDRCKTMREPSDSHDSEATAKNALDTDLNDRLVR